MGRRSGLGKGLGALIPASERIAEEGAQLREVPISHIEPNPFQPRTYFDPEALTTLEASIREVGVLQPILVRMVATDRYELVAGERRWRAATAAGLATIPAIVRTVESEASLEQALVENLHREDLNPLEEAAAYQQLIEDFGLTQEAVASRVGRSRSAVANTIRLLQLPPRAQRYVASGDLSAGHARALLGLPSVEVQEEMADLAVAEELTVREVEEQVRRFLQPDEGEEPGPTQPEAGGPTPSEQTRQPGTTRSAAVLELEQLLADRFDTRVRVQAGRAKGRIVVEFATAEDLDRIARIMTGG